MTQVASVEKWLPEVAPMAWSGGRIHWWRTGKGVVASSFSSLPDGTDIRPEAVSPLYPVGTNRAIGDISPNGRYALVTVERANHWPNPDGYPGALPGAGTYNDLWLLDLASGQTWKLRNLLATNSAALIWPRFDSTGTRIVWAEKWNGWSGPLESWDLHVATITWAGTVPMLTNHTSRRSDGFFEPYGFLDADTILAVSDKAVNAALSQVTKIPVDPTKSVKRISPSTWYEGWGWLSGIFQLSPNYCEFAYQIPGTTRIMFGRTYDATEGSIEFWTMEQDGSDVQRLTYFSKPGHWQFQEKTVILGGLAFNPDNPKQFIVGYANTKINVDNSYKSLLVTLA